MSVKKFPGMRWNPETKEPTVFQREEDVPEGYLDHHPDSADIAKPAPETKAAVVPLARDAIVAHLTEGGIPFKPNQSTKALHDLLMAKLKEHLTASEIAFPETATVQDLLALVPKPE